MATIEKLELGLTKSDFTADVVEVTKDDKTSKLMLLHADKDKVASEYVAHLPEGIKIEDVKAIANYSKQFLEAATVKSGEIAADVFNGDKTIDRVQLTYNGHAGNARNEIGVVVDRSKTFINIKDPENPIVGPGLSIAVKDVANMVTGNTKTRVKDFLKANINA